MYASVFFWPNDSQIQKSYTVLCHGQLSRRALYYTVNNDTLPCPSILPSHTPMPRHAHGTKVHTEPLRRHS